MKELLYNLKKEIKIVAEDIRTAKRSRKSLPDGYVPNLRNLQFNYRVKHIFRCLLRGKTLEQVENSRIKNPPDLGMHAEIAIHLALSHMYLHYTKMEYAHHQIRCGCPECQKIRKDIAGEQAICANQN